MLSYISRDGIIKEDMRKDFQTGSGYAHATSVRRDALLSEKGMKGIVPPPPTTERGRELKLWGLAALYVLVASVLCIVCYPVTISDTMARYAPMADAFARGDWHYAFHPRFGVLFQVVAGAVAWLTGLSGAQAVQVASILFVALAAVPLWYLVRDIFGEKAAWGAVALLLVSDDFTRYAMDGLRDTGKCLAFALLGLGAVRRSGLWFGLGLFVLIALVSYGFAVASVLVFGWCVWALWTRRFGALPLPVLAWALGTLAVSFMVHAYTSHWLPAPHYIDLLGRWL